MKAPVATSTVHLESFGSQVVEAFLRAVITTFHCPNDTGERDELLLLAAQ